MEPALTGRSAQPARRVRWCALWLAGAVLGGVLLLAGCAARSPADLEREGYRSDAWYRERHERVVEGVYIRQRRVSYAELQAMRMRAEFREAWLAQQRRRLAARQRTYEARVARREAFLREQAGTLGLLEQRRREEQATRARLLDKFQQAQAETSQGLEQRRREEDQRRARDLEKFQEAGQPPGS